MQKEIMRHDRRAQNPEPEIEHCRIGEQVVGWQEGFDQTPHVRPGEDELDRETGSDQDEKRDDECFELAGSPIRAVSAVTMKTIS